MSLRRLRLVALGLAFLASPAVLAQDGGEVEVTKPAPAEPKPGDGNYVPHTDEDLERITAEMMRKIETLRGLKFKHDVKRVWKSRDEARDEMLAEIEKQTKPGELDAATRSMVFFGMMRPDQNLKSVFADFIAAGAGGYYFPQTKVFSLVRGFEEDASRPIVYHELVHAVEDQYYDYHERTERHTEAKEDDASAALHALVEGSARRFENEFVASEPGLRERYDAAQMKASMAQMGNVMKQPPALIIAVGMFPYNNGSDFIEAVLPALPGAEPGTDFMATLFNDPPVSTEMILHPEKYLGTRDLPQKVALPDLAPVLGEGWTRDMESTMGQFGSGLVLNAQLAGKGFLPQIMAVMTPPRPGERPSETVTFKGTTRTAIEGWDGDRYQHWVHGDRVTLAWTSVWDSGEDAREFADAYGKVIEKKYRDVKPQPLGEDGRIAATGDASTALVVSGNRVFVAEGFPGDLAAKVVEALRTSTITQDPKDGLPAQAK